MMAPDLKGRRKEPEGSARCWVGTTYQGLPFFGSQKATNIVLGKQPGEGTSLSPLSSHSSPVPLEAIDKKGS